MTATVERKPSPLERLVESMLSLNPMPSNAEIAAMTGESLADVGNAKDVVKGLRPRTEQVTVVVYLDRVRGECEETRDDLVRDDPVGFPLPEERFDAIPDQVSAEVLTRCLRRRPDRLDVVSVDRCGDVETFYVPEVVIAAHASDEGDLRFEHRRTGEYLAEIPWTDVPRTMRVSHPIGADALWATARRELRIDGAGEWGNLASGATGGDVYEQALRLAAAARVSCLLVAPYLPHQRGRGLPPELDAIADESGPRVTLDVAAGLKSGTVDSHNGIDLIALESPPELTYLLVDRDRLLITDEPILTGGRRRDRAHDKWARRGSPELRVPTALVWESVPAEIETAVRALVVAPPRTHEPS